MRRDENLNKRTALIGFGIITILIITLSIVLVKKSGDKENFNATLEINVLSLDKINNGSVYVTAEIINKGDFTFEENKMFIEENLQEGGKTTFGSNAEGSGISTINDKPQNGVEVKELSGTFKMIGPNEIVQIGFSVPPEQVDKKLLLIMQSLASKQGNMKRYITKTQYLN